RWRGDEVLGESGGDAARGRRGCAAGGGARDGAAPDRAAGGAARGGAVRAAVGSGAVSPRAAGAAGVPRRAAGAVSAPVLAAVARRGGAVAELGAARGGSPGRVDPGDGARRWRGGDRVLGVRGGAAARVRDRGRGLDDRLAALGARGGPSPRDGGSAQRGLDRAARPARVPPGGDGPGARADRRGAGGGAHLRAGRAAGLK